MKNKIKFYLLIIFIYFLIMPNIINAVEELPDNGAKISSAQVIQTKTGTGPWDDNDEPGNDSSENNNIVRSFDQVTWTIENTMVLNNSTADSYTGGKIYFEATLPNVFTSETAKWDVDSMGWIEDAQVSQNGLTLTGYYQMSKDIVTVPGKQTLVFIAKIEGAGNGTKFAPTIKTWIGGNNETEYIITTPEKTIVSSAPRYNIKLAKDNAINKRTNINYNGSQLVGRMYGYCFVLQLYNNDVSKGMKGIEFPTGDITFDIDLNLSRTDINNLNIEDITNECTPLLWNYKINSGSANANIPDRNMKWYNDYSGTNDPRNSPIGTVRSDRNNSIFNSGNILMNQDGNKISVTISDYKFDGTYPRYNGEYWIDTSSIVYTENIGCFSSGYFQLFVPDNEASMQENKNYYLKVSDNNFNAKSITNQITSSQIVTTDDRVSSNHVRLNKGRYDHFIDFQAVSELSTLELINRGRAGDTTFMNGTTFYCCLTIGTNSETDEEYYIHSMNQIFKFDGEGFEPATDKIQYSSNSTLQYNAYYLTKKDGTNWSSQEEMNAICNIEDFNVYKNKSEDRKSVV